LLSRLSKLSTLVLFIFYTFVLGLYALWMGNNLPYHNDILTYVYPERMFNLTSFQSGFLPLWNPFIACGLPHLANWQSACFYPFFWLFNLTGIPKGLIWLALLHQGWAFTGFYFWSRSQKIPKSLGFLGAIAFAGSAHFIRSWVNLPFLATASWIPWVFWAMEEHLQKNKLKTALITVICLSLQLLAGYPIFAFYTWLTLAAWIARKGPNKSQIKSILGIGLGCLLLTTVQWLPFWEFLTFSTHGDWNVFPYYIHPRELLTLLDPTFMGIPGTQGYRGDSTNSVFGNLYFGLCPLILWLAGWVTEKKQKSFLTLAALVLLAWMLLPALLAEPSAVRKSLDLLEPSKAIGLFLFFACTSACMFAGQFPIENFKSKPIANGLLILAILDILILPFRLTYRCSDPYPPMAPASLVQDIRTNIADKRIFAAQTNGKLEIHSQKITDEDESRLAGLFVDNLVANTNMVWGFRSASAYLSLYTKNSKNLYQYGSHGFPYSGDLFDVAGVRLFLLPQILPSPKYKMIEKWKDDFLMLNTSASENLRWVGASVDLPESPDILNILAQPHSGWRKKVYLEKNPAGAYNALDPTQRSIPVVAENNPRSNNNRACLNADFSGPGYVVFNDSCAPGWHAWVDGKPQPILRAYGLFMAVSISESGRHQVNFRYEPASFRFGAFISLLSLGLLGFWGMARRPTD
jgi:hypothetical protein